MSTLRTRLPSLAFPPRGILWVLEGGIVLALSAYLTYQCHQPLVRVLSRTLEAQAGNVAILILAVIVFPLALALTAAAVLFAAGLLPPTARTVMDMVVLTVVTTALVIPTLQNARQSPHRNGSAALAQSVATGALNVAPAPLKLERIALGAELHNAGTQPLDVGVLFVRMTNNSRSYCAGKPLSSGKKDRYRLAAGERMVFMSGNCQNGHVALTVWDAAGQRIYQTSALLPPAGE